MELEEKIRFALGTLQPMAEHTLRYLTSVIGVRDPQHGEHLGSGLRCVLNGRRTIVTAAHVVRTACEHYPAFAVSAGHGVPPFLVEGTIQIDDVADLAVYPLPDDGPVQRDDLAFWPEARIEATPDRRATDYLFIHGFPDLRSYPSAHLSGIVSKSLPYGAMQRIDDLPADLKPFEFALNFDPRNLEVEPGEPQGFLPDPHGLSGSPVFRIGASGRSARDWTPEWSRLVGIVTQWRPKEEVLVAVSASRVVELAERAILSVSDLFIARSW